MGQKEAFIELAISELLLMRHGFNTILFPEFGDVFEIDFVLSLGSISTDFLVICLKCDRFALIYVHLLISAIIIPSMLAENRREIRLQCYVGELIAQWLLGRILNSLIVFKLVYELDQEVIIVISLCFGL